MRVKAETLGFATLIIGIAMLAFTFISAYLFLSADLSIVTSSDIGNLFGEALSPLIATVIRVMYLGIMGWIGSLLTVRGIQLLTPIKQTPPRSETTHKDTPEEELEAVLTKDSQTPRKKSSNQRSQRKKGE